MTVSNPADGSGSLDLPGSGSGLVGLEERVRLAGGTFTAGRARDGGWRVHAIVPCVDDAAEGGP